MSTQERPSSEARDRFLQAAARQAPARPGAWARRVWLAGLATLAWLVTITAVLGIRPDLVDLPVPAMVTTMVGLIVAAMTASVFGLARGRSMAGNTTEKLSATAVAIPVALFLLVIAIDPRGASTLATSAKSGAYLWHGWSCDLLVVLVALPLVGIGLIVPRGLIVSRPALAGACVGLAAATWAHLLIRIHCPIGGTGHAVVGHLLPLLPLMALGAWIRGRQKS